MSVGVIIMDRVKRNAIFAVNFTKCSTRKLNVLQKVLENLFWVDRNFSDDRRIYKYKGN